MKQGIKKEVVRFGIVGIFATISQYLLYYLLLPICSPSVAFTLSYILSFCGNYYFSAKFTFQTHTTIKRGFGFALCHLINYGLQLIVLNICIQCGVQRELAPIPVYMICIPINFILVRYVFKH